MHVSNIHLPIRVSASRFFVYGALAFTLVFVFSGVASAQDVFRVTYFDNNLVTGAPDAFVHILNPQNGAFCADIYVWRNDQELSECCSCPITANGLLTIRVSALTINPGDHQPPATSGSITIISDSATASSSPPCDNSTGNAATAPTPTADLRSWATHVNFNTALSAAGAPVFDVTETEMLDTPLSSGEESESASRCGFLRSNGSGAGLCDNACTATGTV